MGIASGGTLTVDVASEIVLDTDDGIIRIRDAGGDYGMFQISNSDFIVRSMVADKDLIFRGNDSDGGGVITALLLICQKLEEQPLPKMLLLLDSMLVQEMHLMIFIIMAPDIIMEHLLLMTL